MLPRAACAKVLRRYHLEELFANYKKEFPNTKLINDGEHATELGYKLIAESVYKKMIQIFPDIKELASKSFDQ
ncbi:MAG: hypothetical protein OHK0056_20050 [Bacteriovoracaceae bacterium]